jgi:cytochrome P450 family 2 subfamily U polypeptide 1
MWMNQTGKLKRQLPRHSGSPIVCNIFQLPSQRPELTFTEWSKELGPVFEVQLFNKVLVVVNSYDAIYEVLVQKGNSFHFRPNKGAYRMELFTEGFSDIIRGHPDHRWKKLRKVCHQKLRMYDTGLKRIEEINNAMIQDLVENFTMNKDKSFNPKDIVFHTVMNVVMALLLGRTFNRDDEVFRKMVELERISGSIASSGQGRELEAFPWLRYFGNQNYKDQIARTFG